jgi:hypothetical protein
MGSMGTIRNTQFPIPNAQCPIPNAQFPNLIVCSRKYSAKARLGAMVTFVSQANVVRS